jgi:hypothetical protein
MTRHRSVTGIIRRVALPIAVQIRAALIWGLQGARRHRRRTYIMSMTVPTCVPCEANPQVRRVLRYE